MQVILVIDMINTLLQTEFDDWVLTLKKSKITGIKLRFLWRNKTSILKYSMKSNTQMINFFIKIC